MKAPGDDTYSSFAVNYLKLTRCRCSTRAGRRIVEGIHDGNFFGTDGRRSVPQLGHRRFGREERVTATIEYPSRWMFAGAGMERWGEGGPQDQFR